MGNRWKATILASRGVFRRRTELIKKIIRNPFFPLLFIAEFIKTAITFAVTTQSNELPIVLVMGMLAVGSTVMWMFAEHLLDEAQETYDEVTDLLAEIEDG